MIDYTPTYTDQYQLTMAQVYFNKGMTEETAIFDYFFRKNPFGGGYTIFAGLEDLLTALEDFHFTKEDIAYLKQKSFDDEFIKYLETFEFTGDIYAVKEGDLVFPNRPVISVEAPLPEAQILETMVLNILNYQSLIATKASRMRSSAGDNKKLVDFGLRRAPGAGGYSASRAAMIGGYDATSNVRAGRDYNIPISGTMAHSFIQRYDDELTAFRDFADVRADDCVLLVDTYDTLKSGVPNAIKVGKEMEERGEKMKGIRLDSGDLAWLAKRSRKMLDDAGLDYVKIAASNQLDEHVIRSLLDQGAPIDLFGVGTSLVTGRPDAALDGVYKLAYANGEPRLKLSENVEKINLPGKKQVYRLKSNGGFYGGDVVAIADEDKNDIESMHHPSDPTKSLNLEKYSKEPLLEKIVEQGRRLTEKRDITDIAEYSRQRLNKLPDEFKRFENPHIYKIGLSASLKDERDRLIEHFEEKAGSTV
ncbi:nicotinate phosphoribosyltransferase [Rhodohalobacter sp. 8-1]|uniref:nicotinate phosphoribosyltransferase n=1 Tax=Rhodohalobacter sp. 8-1 TaxID=3131972 RepID=UPI0030ED1FD0